MNELDLKAAVHRTRAMIRHFILDGDEWSVQKMTAYLDANRVPCTQTSVSACIRDLRKPKFGGLPIKGYRRPDGVFVYRFQGLLAAVLKAEGL